MGSTPGLDKEGGAIAQTPNADTTHADGLPKGTIEM